MARVQPASTSDAKQECPGGKAEPLVILDFSVGPRGDLPGVVRDDIQPVRGQYGWAKDHAYLVGFGIFAFTAGKHFGHSHADCASLMNRTIAQAS
jgi:hypothetical protein